MSLPPWGWPVHLLVFVVIPMCNRYRLKAKPDELIDLFELPRDVAVGPIAAEFYPGKPVPVVVQVSSANHRLKTMS